MILDKKLLKSYYVLGKTGIRFVKRRNRILKKRDYYALFREGLPKAGLHTQEVCGSSPHVSTIKANFVLRQSSLF